MNVRFGTDDDQDATRWTVDTGVAPHADFWNTWDQQTLVTLIDRCIDRTEGNWTRYTYRQWRDRCNLVTNADFAQWATSRHFSRRRSPLVSCLRANA